MTISKRSGANLRCFPIINGQKQYFVILPYIYIYIYIFSVCGIYGGIYGGICGRIYGSICGGKGYHLLFFQLDNAAQMLSFTWCARLSPGTPDGPSLLQW